MSTTKPRPRPKPRAKFATADMPSPASASSSSSVVPAAVADEKKTAQNNVDNFFMCNTTENFAASAARRLQLEREVAQVTPTVVHVSDEEDDDAQSSGGKRRRKEMGLPMAPKMKKLPSWTQKLNKLSDTDSSGILVLSSDSDDDESPQSKRARSTTADKKVISQRKKEKERKKSRSPSMTPPPEVTEAERLAARLKYIEQFPVAPRRIPSPDPLLAADTSTDSIAFLNPELRNIAAKIKTSGHIAPKKSSTKGPALHGRPEIVMITVTYIPHPVLPPPTEPQEWQWMYKLKRTQDLKVVFNRTAEQLKIPVSRLKLCYKHEEVFKSVSPDHFSDIWAEAEFEAYLDSTLAYIRANRFNSSVENALSSSVNGVSSSTNDPVAALNTSATSGQGGDDENEDEDNPESDQLRIQLQAGPGSKKISVKTRKTTIAMTLLVHFTKKVSGKEMTEEEIRAKKIRLRCDGDDVPYEMCCADMNDGDGLETGDCLDVAGWV
ncbi:hypothetical protein FRB93_013788 [Tulasnella sp. JGI-2019a]|nr:hypothetical protein FRB93_013788 [Tulasnella sp. JGI-2019a]